MYGNDIGTLELIIYEKNEDNQLSTTTIPLSTTPTSTILNSIVQSTSIPISSGSIFSNPFYTSTIPTTTPVITTNLTIINTTTTPNLNNKKVIWSLSGKQKREWLQANVTLPIGNYTVIKSSNQTFKLKLLFNILKFKLEFSGNRSTSNRFQADIAIDDLNIEGNERN